MKEFLILFYLLLICNSVIAQSTNSDPVEKKGFIFGFALGTGGIVVNEQNQSNSCFRLSIPNLKFGWMLTPRSAAFIYIPTGIYTRNGKQRSFEAAIPAYQYWFTDKISMLGGVGLNLDFPVIGTSTKGFYFGPAAVVNIGIELWKRKNLILDSHIRCQYGSAKIADIGRRQINGFDILCGFSWY